MNDLRLMGGASYAYDGLGNRASQSVAVNGAAPTVTNYSYNAANQLTSDGTTSYTYDPDGNLTHDGMNAYTWDRANRMLSFGGASYQYDGVGRRVQQTLGVTITQLARILLPQPRFFPTLL